MRPDAFVGCPETDYIYEFAVYIPIAGGRYQWVGYYEDADPAYNKAEEVGGVVAHNVRVSHKKLKEKH